MTKRLKLFLIILLGAIAAACCAVGCKVGTPDRAELLAPYKGGHVTYYANGGCFNRNTSIYVRELYFKADNVPFFDITEDTDGIDVMRSGYDFTGWFEPARYPAGHAHANEIMYTHVRTGETVYPLLDDDGDPVTDSTEDRPMFYAEGKDEQILERDVRIKVSDTAVDAEKIMKSGEDLIVCAKWEPALKFVFKLAVDDKTKTYEYDGKQYKHGDIISEMPFGKEETVDPGSSVSIAFTNTTFVSNYKDEACTEFVGKYNRADYKGQDEIVVWSKFLDGKWSIVKSASDVQTMFNGLSSSSKQFYILRDIDCSSVSSFNINSGVNAKVEGNNHVISSIKIDKSYFLRGVTIAPVLGKIGKSAVIKNLTLKDIEINFKGSEYDFYAISSSVENGATLDGLVIDGVKATLSGEPLNIPGEDRSNWLFGGSGTDEQFLTSNKGVTLKGENTLTIN